MSRRETDGNWRTFTQAIDGLPSDWIQSIAIDQNDNIWVGTNNGLSKYDGAIWTNYSPPLGNSIVDIAIDNEGNIWLAIENQGIDVLQSDGTPLISYTENGSEGDLVNNNVTTVAVDSQGRKWIGYGYSGVSIVSADNQAWLHETYPQLPSDAINDITPSPLGDVWVATSSDAGISRYYEVDYYDGAISGGYWHQVKIGGGSNLNDSNDSQLSFVTFESGGTNGQSSVLIDQSSISLDNVTVWGSGGDGLTILNSDDVTLDSVTVEGNEGNGITIEGGTGGHVFTNLQIQQNKIHGFELNHSGSIEITNSTIAYNGNYAIFTEGTNNSLTLQDSTVQDNYQAVRLAANALLLNNQWVDNETQQIEWTGGTITGDRIWTTEFDAHIILGYVTVADGVSLTIEPAVDVLLRANVSLDVKGVLTAVGTLDAPIYFGPASGSTPWGNLKIGGGAVADSDSSQLRYVISQGGTRGIHLDRSSPTLDHLTLIDNTYGVDVSNSDNVVISNSNFARNTSYGLYNDTPSNIVTAVDNYWGHITGPQHSSNPTGAGQLISDGVLFAPWRFPIAMDGISTFAQSATETDYTFLAFDDETGTFVRHYVDGREVHFTTDGLHDYTLNPDGRRLSYTYNADGSVDTMEISVPGAPSTWVWDFTYQNGKLDSIIDPAGRTTDFTVNEQGHLTQVNFIGGNSESFFYDSRGLMTQHVDKDGSVTSLTYDEFGRVQTHTDPIREVYNPETGAMEWTAEVKTFTPSDTSYDLINQRTGIGDPDNPLNPPVPRSDDLVDGVDYSRGGQSGHTNKWGNWMDVTDALGRTITYERDRANNPTQITLPAGDCLTAEYDEKGNIITAAQVASAACDGGGDPTQILSSAITYEPRFNQIKSQTDTMENTTTYYYDYELDPDDGYTGDDDKLVRVEYPQLQDENGDWVTPTMTYTYNNWGQIETTKDFRDTLTHYVYTQGTPEEAADGSNPLFAPGVTPVPGLQTQLIHGYSSDEAQTTIFKSFTALGEAMMVIRPDERVTMTYTFDDLGRKLSQTNADGIIMTFTYDDAGRLVRQVDDYTADGTTGRNIVTEFTHDSDGRLLNERTEADGLIVQTTKVYDVSGWLASETDGNGNTTRYRYDNAGQLTNVIDPAGHVITTTYDLNGRVEDQIDAEGYVTHHIYNDFGRLETQVQDHGGLNLTTSHTYDRSGNVETITAPDGVVICFEYDNHNRRTAQTQDCGPNGLNLRTEYVYDLNGNPVYATDPRGVVTYSEYDVLNRNTLTRRDDGGFNLATSYVYNATGQVETMVDEQRNVETRMFYDEMNRLVMNCGDSSGLNLCTDYEYDRLGNQTVITDANGIVAETYYNAFGLPVQKINDVGGLQAITTMTYNHVLNLTQVQDSNGNETAYIYTPRNELKIEVNADNTLVKHTFTPRGLEKTLTLQDEEVITFIYNSLGQRTDASFSSGGSQTFVFDDGGRMTSAEQTINGNTTQETYLYDSLGAITRTVQAVAGQSWQVDYEYDYLAGTTIVSYPSGAECIHTMDRVGRLDLVTDGVGATIADYAYNNVENYNRITYANNVVNQTNFDALGRIMQVSTVGAATIADYRYGYDNVGNRLYMQRVHQSGQPADVYEYDNLYQLTQVWYGADATDPATVTSYDLWQSYDLDTLGNRLAVDEDGIVKTYGPNDGQQLINSMNRYESVDNNPLVYDLRGNTLDDTTNAYTYDILNRQTSMIGPNGNATYLYDARGRRVAKTVNGTTTFFVYDINYRVLEERDGSNTLLARYTYGQGIDELLTMERDGSTYTYHRDALGSITEVTDSSGSLVERYEYDAYGETTIYDGSDNQLATSAIGNPYLFTSRRYDPESGNYYYRARMYNPTLGRFLSMDPLGFAAGDYNLYRYAFNNPLLYTDPTGEIIPLVIGVVVIGITIADYAITAWDIVQATLVLNNPCASDVDKLLAGFEIVLAGIFELLEPDEFLPVSIPADDVARKLLMREVKEAAAEGGMEGFERTVRNELGDEVSEKIFKEMGLDDLVRVLCSFSADTPVSTLGGFEIISLLEVGDYVLAYDEATGQTGYYPISAVWAHEDPVIVYLAIDGETIETTPEHPFYTANGEWVAAGELQTGEEVRKADDSYGVVENVEFVYQLQPMYNLTVATVHTYFVGDEQWLVHNDCDIFFKNFKEGSGFSGVFDPKTSHFLTRPSGNTLLKDGTVPVDLVPQRGGHGIVNRQLAEQGIDPSGTVGFTVFYDNPGQLSVAWNSGSVNSRNWGNYAAPIEFRQSIMDAL